VCGSSENTTTCAPRRKNAILATKRVTESQPSNLDYLIANSQHWFAFLEPPDHTRLRSLVSKAFGQKSAESMRPYVRKCAQELLGRVRAHGRMDVMKDFACILPLNVIATMLGVPPADFPRLVAWTERLARIFDPLTSLEELATLDHASQEFMEYLRMLIALRRAQPEDDLLSALIAAQDESGRLSESELVSVCILIFGAGEETMVNLIGNGTLALIRHPDQMEFLRAHPEVMPKAVEEFLRYDAPLQMTSRTALHDAELGGKQIRKGDQLYLALASGNRDPEQFAAPDELDVTREKNHHLSFAAGHHLCVGAPLARVEAQEAFGVMLETLRDMELATDSLGWRDHTVLRGLTALPVTFT
jgi:hypothetical protein